MAWSPRGPIGIGRAVSFDELAAPDVEIEGDPSAPILPSEARPDAPASVPNGAYPEQHSNDKASAMSDDPDEQEPRADAGNANGHEQEPGAQAALPFVLFDDCGTEARKEWLVERLLGVGEASSFYGEPGSGKSVLAEDLGLHVAAGKAWHGRAVKQGAVLYLALERAQLVKRRAVAFRLHTGLVGLPFAIFGGELDFRDIRTADAVAKMFEQLAFATRADPVLGILDTVSRGLCGGDENSPKRYGCRRPHHRPRAATHRRALPQHTSYPC
jgi:hypothetical protein